MCARYTYFYKWKQLHKLLQLMMWPQDELAPRFNVAPTQPAPVVRLDAAGQQAGVMLRWGLVPSWSDGPAAGPPLNNARGESVFSKPSFREAVAKRRCLVPVSGFYEWQEVPGERTKQPYWIGRRDREPLCFAGLWESWQDRSLPASAPLETFAIVTTTPSTLMAPIHDRMPVMVAERDWSAWLDPATSESDVQALIRPYESADLEAFPVSRAVNKMNRDDADLIEQVIPPPQQAGLFD